ncbi:MAG TPA: LacI family DNA-binding transcriptional regulator [Trebonia sp.]
MQPHDDATGRPPQDGDRVPGRKTTLAAIAAAAGVSLATVSKVVNGRPDVGPGTRARVERLLEEHGYARPRHRRAGLIDLVLADRPWAVEILRGVADWSAAHETEVAVSPETRVAAFSARHGSARPASWASAVVSHDSRGVILVTFSGLTGDQLSQLRRAAIPVVVVDAATPRPAFRASAPPTGPAA